MAAQSEVIRQSDLLNQLVIDRTTMEELGRVEVLWMYPQAHRVLGFVCKSGLLGSQKLAFQLAQVDAIGASVLIKARPEKTTAEKVRQLESLINHEIWSDEGNRIGKITDCLFNWQTGEIGQYLFISGGWQGILGEIYQLPPAQILSFGKQRVLVAESAVPRFQVYRAGISQKLTQVGESLKDEAVQELSSIAKQAEVTTEQAKEQLQQFTEQARTKAQGLSQQFRAKAHTFRAQVKGKTQTLLEQAKEKGQILVEQVEEGIESLAGQAEDLLDQVTDDLPLTKPTPRDQTPSSGEPVLWDDDEAELWGLDEPVHSSPTSDQATSDQASSNDDDDDLWGWEDSSKFKQSPPPSVQSPVPPRQSSPPLDDDDDDDEPWI